MPNTDERKACQTLVAADKYYHTLLSENEQHEITYLQFFF